MQQKKYEFTEDIFTHIFFNLIITAAVQNHDFSNPYQTMSDGAKVCTFVNKLPNVVANKKGDCVLHSVSL